MSFLQDQWLCFATGVMFLSRNPFCFEFALCNYLQIDENQILVIRLGVQYLKAGLNAQSQGQSMKQLLKIQYSEFCAHQLMITFVSVFHAYYLIF